MKLAKRLKAARGEGPARLKSMTQNPLPSLRSKRGVSIVGAGAVLIIFATVLSIAPTSPNGNAGRQAEATPSASSSFDPAVIGEEAPDEEEVLPDADVRDDTSSMSAAERQAKRFARKYVKSLFTFDTTTTNYLDFWSLHEDAWSVVQSDQKPASAFDTMMEDLGYSEGQWLRWTRDGRTRTSEIVRVLWDDENKGFQAIDDESHMADVLLKTTDKFLGKTETTTRAAVVTVVCPGSTLQGAESLTECSLWGVEVHQ